LPTYSFAKKRHWLEPETTADAASPSARAKSDAVLPTSPESFATVAESKASTETNANARSSATRALIENQLSLMQQQLEVLRIRRMQRRD
jgi:acyl transferase domain-containing protein